MTPIFFAWIASIVYGTQNIIGKVTTNNAVKNPWLLNFLWQGLALLLVLPLALYFGAGVPQAWVPILWGGLFWAATTISYLYLIKLFDASIVGSFYNFRTAIGPIIGVLWLSEVLTGFQVMMIALIFIGGILITLDEQMSFRTFFRPATIIVIPAIASSALLNAFIKVAIAQNGYWTASLWVIIISQVILCCTLPLFWREIKSVQSKSYWPIFVLAATSVIADLAANYAYADNISVSGAIMALPFSLLFAIILSRLAPSLLEKHTAKVYAIRLAAAALMIFAAIKLS